MYPLVNVYIAMENGPFTADLPLKKCDFPIFFVCLPEGNGNKAIGSTIPHLRF
jgi:hypothetical protein